MMTIIAVDDEKLALENALETVKAATGAEVIGFRKGMDAKKFARENSVDVAFLDIEMRDMDGIALGRELKLINPNINIIFTTGYEEYTGAAISMHASGYIMKPVTVEKVKKEMEDLRYPVDNLESKKRVVAKAFGTFDVYIDDSPVEFKYNKTKELFAYLIDRNGAMVSNNDIIENLWEEDEPEQHQSYLKNIRKDLKDVLENLNAMDVLSQQWGKLGVNPEKIDCDYYEWLSGNARGINAYHGEYMSQYSWAEFTNGRLDMESYK